MILLFYSIVAFALPLPIVEKETNLARLSHSEIRDGQVTLLRWKGPPNVTGFVADAILHFFPCERESCAIVPVPYGIEKGIYPIHLRVLSDYYVVPLKVAPGKYATTKLKVDERLVHPSPEEEKRIAAERRQMDQVYKSPHPEPLFHEKFSLPVEAAITGDFGTRRMFNGELRSAHMGVDLRANAATEVKAANDGEVRIADDFFYSGNFAVLDHGLGIFSTYSHLSRLDVSKGQKVKKGHVLGRAGATGRVTGPHLHWTIKVGGIAVDTLQFEKVMRGLQNRS